jgi:hypothetical protein
LDYKNQIEKILQLQKFEDIESACGNLIHKDKSITQTILIELIKYGDPPHVIVAARILAKMGDPIVLPDLRSLERKMACRCGAWDYRDELTRTILILSERACRVQCNCGIYTRITEPTSLFRPEEEVKAGFLNSQNSKLLFECANCGNKWRVSPVEANLGLYYRWEKEEKIIDMAELTKEHPENQYRVL